MKDLRLLGLLPAVAVLIFGCSIGPAPAPVSSSCAWDKIIHPSLTADSIETLRQVDEHNKALRAACPGL